MSYRNLKKSTNRFSARIWWWPHDKMSQGRWQRQFLGQFQQSIWILLMISCKPSAVVTWRSSPIGSTKTMTRELRTVRLQISKNLTWFRRCIKLNSKEDKLTKTITYRWIIQLSSNLASYIGRLQAREVEYLVACYSTKVSNAQS